ncbi:MAG: ral secretion pathway protein type secretion system ATPase, partial [Candidatus Saccharibacteria bacterium]|nr:ral secretion pathway protein type secretion system ATPase [Candidatus Saccharibacteria bacterium]
MVNLRIVPLQVDASNIYFGITTTTSKQAMDELRRRYTDKRVTYAIISETGYREYLRLHNPPKKIEYADVEIAVASNEELFHSVSATLQQVLADDMLAYLVKQAYQLKASDLHFENQKDGVRIRFRVDGILHPIAELAADKYRQLMSSVAIAANISTSAPDAQSGHINTTYRMATGEEVTVNLRVETIPTVYGQDVVMRLFNLHIELLNLDKLGLSPAEREVVDDVIKHPTGMVLVVGPTGSGKTTTLYSLIETLNSEEKKIITLEDPVEYFLPGVVQIPVKGDDNEKGFADKLRAVLRFDPDTIMVGEIRDQDTARTALQAALTGHLVLSTFHASSASAALSRMLDYIGINPLFASAIHLIMSQRLVRRLDETTRQPYQPDEGLKAQLQSIIDTLPPNYERPDVQNITLYRPGTSVEHPFGFTGQIAIREQLRMTPGVQQLLRLPPGQVTTDMLEAKAIEEGMLTMLQDGVLKALRGETTLEEVFRVVG